MATSSHVRFGLGKAGAFDRAPGAEEPIQRRLIADDPQRRAPRLPHDATGNQDDAVEEGAKLHTDILSAIAVPVHHQGKPRLDVPGQRRDDHVGPII
jgi:hypothetical protein